ncbi:MULTISPECIES: 23S ribosomal RNA methyltransferase Erm [Corynebacterium]|uniref:23S ribosomal RNA methyltransferase Erm n=1 Tax=Corynebacterium TaxID=1716 RepID=UPI00257995C3|nr:MULTISPECIES: 23S ribosomal RNA methyltransferase Erm [Corynebacterium]
MPTYRGGRHEYGQNFLVDQKVIADIIDLVKKTSGPIVEIGPGGGAITEPLSCLGRKVTAIDIDPKQARRVQKKLPDVAVINQDFLRYPLPTSPHVIVGNLPFHITTAVLRKLLHAPGWSHAVLLVQWEVARRRAGVGGATMMTAQWWPWFEFRLHSRVSSSAFEPSPGVDGGLMVIARRGFPLLLTAQAGQYRSFVHAVYTGRGRGMREIVGRLLRSRTATSEIRRWMEVEGLRPAVLPKDLDPAQWAGLFRLAVDLGWRPRGREQYAR